MNVGFSVHSNASYATCMASTRIRVYDVISYLQNYTNVVAKIYESDTKFDAVIFQKCFQDEYIQQAKTLRKRGVKIVFDINVNYVYLEGAAKQYVTKEQKENVFRMLELSDIVVTSSERLNGIYSQYHPNVVTIEESIDSEFFKHNKKHTNDFITNLLYCGYGVKADQILFIKDVLDSLSFNMIYVCDKDPKISNYTYQFYPYDYKNLPELLMKGDIKIAPRDMTDSYNWGHAFTKIGYPMSVGIPVIASPVPSYIGRNAVICNNDQEWYTALKRLLDSAEEREQQGQLGKDTAKLFSIDIIGEKYLELFRKLGYDCSEVRRMT